MPKVIQIFVDKNIGIAIIQDKNIFIQLLANKFPGDLRNAITDKKASAELLFLTYNEGKDLYIYYYWTKGLLKEIYGQGQVTNNSRDTVSFSLFKQQFLKDTIIRFILHREIISRPDPLSGSGFHSIHPDPPRGAPNPPLSAPTDSGSALIQARASFQIGIHV